MKYAMFTRKIVLTLLFSTTLAHATITEIPALNVKISEQSLAEARKDFKTDIVLDSFENKDDLLEPPADVFTKVKYPTPLGKMSTYLTLDPKDGKKHPAVIWVHGGYGGNSDSDYFWEPQPAENDQSGSAFRKAGLVLMLPSFRGEDGNPGRYEMFYGELDDLENARAWLAKQPWVDANRIYLAGHSTGGTRVLLASEYSDKYRAIFSLGGVADLKTRVEISEMMVPVPFKPVAEEYRLRSPATFVKSIKTPTFYFEGGDYYWGAFNKLAQVAKENKIPLHIFKIKDADHFNIITPVTKMVAKKIIADDKPEVNISFSSEDLEEIQQGVVQ